MFKALKESIAAKIEEKKELRAIEQEAYEEEKVEVDKQRLIDNQEAARERGKAKAHKSSNAKGFFEKLDKAAERMGEYDAKQKRDPIQLIKMGSSPDDDDPTELVKFGTSDKDSKPVKLYKV